MTLVIDRPQCDWIALPAKDKRRGAFWMCRACNHKKMAKDMPKCRCKPIPVPDCRNTTVIE